MAQGSGTVKNLRRTAAWARAVRILFGPDNAKLSPTMILSLMNAAGIPVTKDMKITADTAQIIMAGGAFASNIATAASVSSYVAPTAMAVQASLDIMEQLGWVKAESPGAELITLGVDVALVVAGSGANVLADLKLVIDIAQISAIGQAVADAQAQSNLRDVIMARQQTQMGFLSSNFHLYASGKMSSFELMGKIAEESPDYFAMYFPEYSAFFPIGFLELYAEGGYTDVTGYHGSNAKTYVRTILKTDHKTIADIIWNKLVCPLINHYKNQDAQNKSDGKISVQTLGLMSTLPPYISTYPLKFDCGALLKAMDLTPHDFGDPFLENYILSKSEPVEPAISLNGVDTLPQNRKVKISNALMQVGRADMRGNILGILQNPDAKQALGDWGQPRWIADGFTQPKGQKLFIKLQNTQMQTARSRSYYNYFSMLSMVEYLKQSSYFKVVQDQMASYDIFGKSQDFQKKHQDLIFKMHARKLNKLAIENIAWAFGVPPSKLKLQNKPEPGKPAVFKTV